MAVCRPLPLQYYRKGAEIESTETSCATETADPRTLLGFVPDPEEYWKGDPFKLGKVAAHPVPLTEVEARAARQRQAKAALQIEDTKQILFGDMHVHSTYSVDAYRFSLPLMQGSRGAHPPADACDYARYISQLDFYWITDHAESYTPNTGRIRSKQCASATRWRGIRTILTW